MRFRLGTQVFEILAVVDEDGRRRLLAVPRRGARPEARPADARLSVRTSCVDAASAPTARRPCAPQNHGSGAQRDASRRRMVRCRRRCFARALGRSRRSYRPHRRGRIYDDAPQAARSPISPSATRHRRATGARAPTTGAEHVLTLHVWSRAAGKQGGPRHHAARCARPCTTRRSTLEDHRLVNLRHEFSEARREADGDTYHGIVRFRAVTEPLSVSAYDRRSLLGGCFRRSVTSTERRHTHRRTCIRTTHSRHLQLRTQRSTTWPPRKARTCS